MTLELNAEESRLVAEVLKNYISNLREEIVKTEKHEWREGLHREEGLLKEILARLTLDTVCRTAGRTFANATLSAWFLSEAARNPSLIRFEL